MKTSPTILYALLCFMLFNLVIKPAVADIENSKDHPQLKRYEGAKIVKYSFHQYDELIIPLGKAKHSKQLMSSIPAEGAVTRLTYGIPIGRSPLEVIRNYQLELEADGFEELFSGSKNELGNGFSEAAGYKEIIWKPNIPALTLNSDTQRFLAMEKKVSDTRLVILLYAVENRFWANNLNKNEGIEKGQTLLQVDIVESKVMESKMVIVAADEMAHEITASGRVSLYGIYFDSNKAAIKAESDPTLAEIAKLLNNNGSLKLLIVGHTDTVGTFDYNMELSLKRATAVIDELGTNYGIATNRLRPVGVAYACPIAPNTTEEQRAKNRRVELVDNNH